jgi:hypothetical protein
MNPEIFFDDNHHTNESILTNVKNTITFRQILF